MAACYLRPSHFERQSLHVDEEHRVAVVADGDCNYCMPVVVFLWMMAYKMDASDMIRQAVGC